MCGREGEKTFGGVRHKPPLLSIIPSLIFLRCVVEGT